MDFILILRGFAKAKVTDSFNFSQDRFSSKHFPKLLALFAIVELVATIPAKDLVF